MKFDINVVHAVDGDKLNSVVKIDMRTNMYMISLSEGQLWFSDKFKKCYPVHELALKSELTIIGLSDEHVQLVMNIVSKNLNVKFKGL